MMIAITAALFATPVPPTADSLTTEIGALDAKVFDADNRCDLPTFSDYVVRQIFCWGDEHHAGTRLPIAEAGGDGLTHVLIKRAALLARRFEEASGVYQCD